MDQEIRIQEMILRLKQQRTINVSLCYSLKEWMNENLL